jgi:hypothetical protein
MATTTNYGWDTPDDTDLVKDGAAAIRTLGNSVDTTTKALNPETTLGDIAYRSATSNTNTRLAIGSAGQVLTVAAGVPSWASPSDQTPLTTKGDVFTFSTVDARLGVGANGTVLTADSAETTGLKWAAPSAAAFVGVSASNGSITTGAGGNTNITFDTEQYDTNSFHSTSSNTQNFTIPSGKGGKYLFTWSIFWTTGNGVREVYVRKNSNAFRRYDCLTSNNTNTQTIAEVYDLSASDVIFAEVYNISQNTIGDAKCTITYLGA